MTRDIYLYGAAGLVHGRHFRLDVSSPAEAVRALLTLRPGLRPMMRQGYWRVIVGTPRLRNTIDIAHYGMNLGSQPLHFVPATRPQGSDEANVGKIAAGVILTTVGVMFAQYYLIMPGISLIAGGIGGLLTQTPEQSKQAATENARPGDSPSFLFNGVTNNGQQGGPVPLVYGTHLVGSIVIDGGVNDEDIAV